MGPHGSIGPIWAHRAQCDFYRYLSLSFGCNDSFPPPYHRESRQPKEKHVQTSRFFKHVGKLFPHLGGVCCTLLDPPKCHIMHTHMLFLKMLSFCDAPYIFSIGSLLDSPETIGNPCLLLPYQFDDRYTDILQVYSILQVYRHPAGKQTSYRYTGILQVDRHPTSRQTSYR